jgi:tetratricopeptide (TPR) repeat protein
MPAISVEQALQMANAQFQMGQLQAAEAMYRKILEVQPTRADIWLQLGEACFLLGQNDEGAACSRQAIQLHGTSLSDCVDLGNTLMNRERLPEAITAFEQALTIDPSRPEVHFNLGNVHAKLDDLDRAITCYQRALALRPDYQKARTNLGCAYLDQGGFDEALAQFQLLSDGSSRYYNLGVTLTRAGRSEEAVSCYLQAIAARENYGAAYWALSSELLRQGRFEEGWRVHARYGQCPRENLPYWKSVAPQWDGASLNGATLLVYEDQGYGDTILFLRYLPLVRERLGHCRILLECAKPLVRLLKLNSALGVEIVERGQPAFLPPIDRQIAFFELPFALQRWDPLPITAPYLQASPVDREAWRTKLDPASRLRVGIAWAGNPKHLTDRRRSISAEKMRPLFDIPGITFYSLQIQPPGGQPQALLEAGLIDLTPSITDFADTAALVSELDLVITVDTAIAHLAGALGRPVWTLLSFVSDWRYARSGEDTPWYPTMRLFRQPASGDWDSVIRLVCEELGRESPLSCGGRD